jgi:hypothetical protein
MKNTRQAKGGKARTPAKQAAARENGKLGGRPRNADKAKVPHLFLGHFGYDIDSDGTSDGQSDHTRFTALIEARDIRAALRGFRRLLRHPRMKEFIGDTYVELLSCCEVTVMPREGFVAFVEHSYRDPSEPSYRGSISGTGITLRQAEHDGVTYYGYGGAFKKGKHYVAVSEDEETTSEAGRQSH